MSFPANAGEVSQTHGKRPDLWIALGLALGTLVGQGFSRFAYALLLPPMKADLAWNFTQAGLLNGANAAGYIVGAATAPAVARAVGARATYLGNFVLCALLLLAMAATDNYAILFALRLLSGICIAYGFVAGSGLVHSLGPGMTAIYLAGPGAGIALSGIVVPGALSAPVDESWRLGWIALGAMSVLMLLPATWAASKAPKPHEGHGAPLIRSDFKHLTPSFIGYGLFGAGYAGYMTFIIALLRDQQQAGWITSLFWIILGIASAVSIPLWNPLLLRLRGGQGPALTAAVTLLGTIPVLFHPTLPMVLLSGIIFGGSFLANVVANLGIGRRELPPARWTAAFGALTTCFALGQAIGPVVSGWVSDFTGNLTAGLWVAPVLLILSAGVALLQTHRAEVTVQ